MAKNYIIINNTMIIIIHLSKILNLKAWDLLSQRAEKSPFQKPKKNEKSFKKFKK